MFGLISLASRNKTQSGIIGVPVMHLSLNILNLHHLAHNSAIQIQTEPNFLIGVLFVKPGCNGLTSISHNRKS
jgi:hypothetical protein